MARKPKRTGPDGSRSRQPNEVLVPVAGERFATYTGRRVAVRDFADGSVLWEQPVPSWLATVTMDHRGEAVAIAYGSNFFAGDNRITMTTRADMRPRQFSFDNIPLLAGCLLGLSPGGDLLVCASLREVVLIRPDTQEVVQRRRLGAPWMISFRPWDTRWGWLSSRRRQQGRTDPRLGVARTMRRMLLARRRMP